LSNLAAALAADPGIADALDPLVVMGGTHRRAGVTPWAERNLWCDPAAAAAVVDSSVEHLVMVGMDATFAVPLDQDDADALATLGTPAAGLTARLVRERIEWYRRDDEMARLGAAPLHDPLAVAHLVAPELLALHPASSEAETEELGRLGQTTYDVGRGGGRLRVALGADRDTYLDVLTSALSLG
jgi:inosine-uridine nucleoside N-ribohydrolase